MDPVLLDLIIQYPWLSQVIMTVGALRLIFKPLFSFIAAFIKSTPTTDDDVAWAKLKDSKITRTLVWVVDYLSSIKIPAAAAAIGDIKKD